MFAASVQSSSSVQCEQLYSDSDSDSEFSCQSAIGQAVWRRDLCISVIPNNRGSFLCCAKILFSVRAPWMGRALYSIRSNAENKEIRLLEQQLQQKKAENQQILASFERLKKEYETQFYKMQEMQKELEMLKDTPNDADELR